MLKIGNANGVNVFLDEAEGMNRHIIIFGKSGSGKSVAQQILCKRILEGGGTVLALDLHNTLGEKNIFPPFRETLGLTLHEIDAYAEGIPVDLFKPAVYEDEQAPDQQFPRPVPRLPPPRLRPSAQSPHRPASYLRKQIPRQQTVLQPFRQQRLPYP